MKIFYYLLLCLYPSLTTRATCYDYDPSTDILASMAKQQLSLAARMDDFIDALKANRKATTKQTYIIECETIAYLRLRERLKIETILLDKTLHYSNKAKETAALQMKLILVEQERDNNETDD